MVAAMRTLLLALLAGLWLPLSALAHPHVFIDAGLKVLVVDGKITAVDIRWTWDEVYSDSWIKDFDSDRDGQFNAAETRRFIAEATAGLENFAQFIFVHDAQGTRHPVAGVSNFRLSRSGNSVVYDFRGALKTPLPVSAGPVTLGAYDESYYIDVAFPKAADVGVIGAASCTAKVVEDHKHPIYMGTVSPQVVEISCGAS